MRYTIRKTGTKLGSSGLKGCNNPIDLESLEGFIMFKNFVMAGIAAGVVAIAAPASAATVVYGAINPGGVVTLTPAGPGAVASPISFDVSGAGAFTATFTFTNPFSPAAANGSASFDYDPDVITFTNGSFSGGGFFNVITSSTGAAITINHFSLPAGAQNLTISGTINGAGIPGGGNEFARIGGSVTLTAVPEPATWALFILGFGAIGHTMRRRSSKVGVAKASLNFA